MAAVRKKKLKLSTSRALELLWKKFGGPNKVAEHLKIHQQLPVNWTKRGKVPMLSVSAVANKLNVVPQVLNFKEVSSFLNLKTTWEETIKKAKLFSREEVHYILSGEMPK